MASSDYQGSNCSEVPLSLVMSVTISFIPLVSSSSVGAGIVLCHRRECCSKGMLYLRGGTQLEKHSMAEPPPGAGTWGSIRVWHRRAVTKPQRPCPAVVPAGAPSNAGQQPALPYSPRPGPGLAAGASRAGPGERVSTTAPPVGGPAPVPPCKGSTGKQRVP